MGVRHPLTEAEGEAFDKRTDERVKLCRRFKLDYWLGTFAKGDDSERDFLWIGKMIARIGYQDSYEVKVTPANLVDLISDTTMKLRQAGIQEEPALWIQFDPDY